MFEYKKGFKSSVRKCSGHNWSKYKYSSTFFIYRNVWIHETERWWFVINQMVILHATFFVIFLQVWNRCKLCIRLTAIFSTLTYLCELYMWNKQEHYFPQKSIYNGDACHKKTKQKPKKGGNMKANNRQWSPLFLLPATRSILRHYNESEIDGKWCPGAQLVKLIITTLTLYAGAASQ